MTKKELLEAIESMTPTPAQKKAMLDAIEAKASVPKRLPLWGGAAVVAVAFLALWIAVPKGAFIRQEATSAPTQQISSATTGASVEADATSAPTQEETELASLVNRNNVMVAMDNETLKEFLQDGSQITEIQEVEDLEALMHLIPEGAVLLEEGDNFRRYLVDEQIWEIRIEDGSTRLIVPDED